MAAYFVIRRTRKFPTRKRPLDTMTNAELIAEYRLPKAAILDICSLLRNDLQPTCESERCLTVEEQVLIALKVLASGSFQNSAKDNVNVAQSTVSRVLCRFMDSLIGKKNQFIKMPTGNQVETVKQQFYAIARFSGVVGAIDGTHIPIISPAVDEHLFVNRKGFHSINVQAVCDANMVFLDVVCKWPGSSHDSYVLRQSNLYDHFEGGSYGNGILLGDSGYPLKSWLMIPVANPLSDGEIAYNRSHKKTRSMVEKAFGVLKQRWRIIDHTGGRLCYTPLKACKIAMCCCILHNICRSRSIPMPRSTPVTDISMPESANYLGEDEDEHNGNITRNRIIATFV